MEINDLLALTPESLVVAQERALRAHVIEVLRKSADAIESGRYSDVPTHKNHDSDGNIFHYIGFVRTPYAWDIGDVIEELQKLERLIRSTNAEVYWEEANPYTALEQEEY